METLRRRADYARVFETGGVVNSSHFVLRIFNRNDGAQARIGVGMPGKYGNAVARNRMRRLILNAARTTTLPLGTDIIIIPRMNAHEFDLTAGGAAVQHELGEVLARLARRSTNSY